MQLSTVNGTELDTQEWRDSLFLCYGLEHPDLHHYCDGCNAKFSICNALDCKRGGLATSRNNELRYGVVDLAGKAFTPSHMRNDPLIFAGCAMKRPKSKPEMTTGTTDRDNAPPPEATEQKGDLLIRNLWHNGTDSVHNMRVVNTDAKSHLENPLEKCLQEVERAKKRMYLEACLQQRRNFSPFVDLVDGFLCVDATATLKKIASCLATKWRQTYSRTCG